MSKEKNWQRYLIACHAMQSGVAMEMNQPERATATSPKMLRVGINAAMVEHSALVHLLIAKGVFSEEDYIAALADGMEAEVKQYEERISKTTSLKVTLG